MAIGLHYIIKIIVEGIFAKQIVEMIASGLTHVVHYRGNDQKYIFVLEAGEQRAQGLGRGIVDIIDRRGVDA